MVGLLALLLVPMPATAADPSPDAGPDVAVTIDVLTPGQLAPGEPVTISGTVRNDGDVSWTSTQAYASIAGPQGGRLGERPLEVGVADLGAGVGIVGVTRHPAR